jgi:hypothetical protein
MDPVPALDTEVRSVRVCYFEQQKLTENSAYGGSR